MEQFYPALIGGVIIGIAVSLMLIFNGRVTGISGIYGQMLRIPKGDTLWRVLFVLGLVLGGLVIKIYAPEKLANTTDVNTFMLIVAGLLVGYGTQMGSGCTSGHAVCGISRFSKRSIISTIVFMLVGIVTASVIALVRGA